MSQAYRTVTQAGGTVAVLVVPIRCGARVEGLLYVGATRPRTFTDSEETILQRLADHAAIALHMRVSMPPLSSAGRPRKV